MTRLPRLLAASLLAAPLPLAADPGDSRGYTVQIDCNSTAIDNTGTANTVVVEYWHEDTRLLATSLNHGSPTRVVATLVFNAFSGAGIDFWTDGPPQCGPTANAYWVAYSSTFPAGTADLEPTSIVVRTTGGDAFWIDYLSFYDSDSDDLDMQFGDNNDFGYCLSTDPEDATRSWKDHVQGCYKALRFDLTSGRVFIAG